MEWAKKCCRAKIFNCIFILEMFDIFMCCYRDCQLINKLHDGIIAVALFYLFQSRPEHSSLSWSVWENHAIDHLLSAGHSWLHCCSESICRTISLAVLLPHNLWKVGLKFENYSIDVTNICHFVSCLSCRPSLSLSKSSITKFT